MWVSTCSQEQLADDVVPIHSFIILNTLNDYKCTECTNTNFAVHIFHLSWCSTI